MDIAEPYKAWIEKNVGKDITDHTRFQFKITAHTDAGEVVNNINFDLAWYILIQFNGEEHKRLEMVKYILQDPLYLAAFKSSIVQQSAKRAIAEFLIFDYTFLNGLKQYIDFTKLDDPIDFISHVLFIKYGNIADSAEIDKKRIANVRAVLSTGFKLPATSPVKSENVAVRKVLYMDEFPEKFLVIRELLTAGFSLFGTDVNSNNELAVEMINMRKDANCQMIIKEYADKIKSLVIRIPGIDQPGNVADYFYWIKEDMQAVRFIKSMLGLELTPTP